MGTVPTPLSDIEQDFQEGVLEVYGEFFTHTMPFYFLDLDASDVNSYGETTNKVYKEPVYLVARIKIDPKDGDKAVNRDSNTAKIRVPTKSMWENGLSTESKDLAKMIQGKFVWNGINYQVKRVQPLSMIGDHFLFHEFYCEEIILDYDYREEDGEGW